MPQHKTNAYKDGFQWVVFCQICGNENPVGDCPGRYVPHGERKVSEKSVDKLVDNELKRE